MKKAINFQMLAALNPAFREAGVKNLYSYRVHSFTRLSYNYNFWCRGFHARKVVLDRSPCKWEIVPVKRADVRVTNNNMIRQ